MNDQQFAEIELDDVTMQALAEFPGESWEERLRSVLDAARRLPSLQLSPSRSDLVSIATLDDASLAGKRPGYAAERIRRSMLAIQSYNEGRRLPEQIEINVGSLRKLAAASAAAVGEWVRAHKDEIDAYGRAQGHSGGPGSKFNRGKDVATLVCLAWNKK